MVASYKPADAAPANVVTGNARLGGQIAGWVYEIGLSVCELKLEGDRECLATTTLEILGN